VTDPRPHDEGLPDDDEVVEGELLDEPDESDGAPDRPLDEPAPAGDISVETLVADLERLAVEREQYLDAYRRTQADFENYKKQIQRRADDDLQRRLGTFVERFLPVLDACDAARAHGAGDAVEPIAAALLGALEKEGLERIDPLGETFDPAVADAVVHEPGDGGDHVVSEVLRAGYSWQGRVLRPAMVKVTD
jgi:molecular chaperone GrpE